VFPHVYELGVKNLQNIGLKTKEFPTARAEPDFLYENPKARAEAVNAAFADPEVDAIISTVGGDDSIRILPYLENDTVRSNPKILMGYSDTTTLLAYCNQLGLVTFHGPSVMAGFSQMENLPSSFAAHVGEMLFHPNQTYEYRPYDTYSEGYPEFAQNANLGKVNTPRKNPGWKWLQGKSVAKGHLFGGNVEILEWLRGTPYWPSVDFWNGKILFLETSEEKPHRSYVRRWLRTFGILGGLYRIAGLLVGRARDYSDEEKEKLDQNIVAVVSGEFHRADLPIITNMDFGHTDPQLIIPLGVKAEIDCETKRFRLIEAALK
jgi:muramoyltetrapeptide carboxypeptidase LdcA involved in peptidoglycan recycling